MLTLLSRSLTIPASGSILTIIRIGYIHDLTNVTATFLSQSLATLLYSTSTSDPRLHRHRTRYCHHVRSRALYWCYLHLPRLLQALFLAFLSPQASHSQPAQSLLLTACRDGVGQSQFRNGNEWSQPQPGSSDLHSSNEPLHAHRQRKRR